jgi:hypothetical protein
MVASVKGEYIYTNTPTIIGKDIGTLFQPYTSGTQITAGINVPVTTVTYYPIDGYIAGDTWTVRSSSGARDWNAQASSSNGKNVVAAAFNGSVFGEGENHQPQSGKCEGFKEPMDVFEVRKYRQAGEIK